MTLKRTESSRYKDLMEESISIAPNDPVHLYDFGCWLRNHNERQRGQDMIDQAIHIWGERLVHGRMMSWDYGWYASALESIGEYTKAKEVRSKAVKKATSEYNSENLTQIK